jgi:hypothetical protein
MRSLVIKLIARIARGEQYEHLVPAEMRCQLAVFAAFPIFIGGFLYVGHPLLHGASLPIIWLYMLASLLATLLLVVAWAILIPLRASMVCPALLWILVVWDVCHVDLAKF